MVKDVEEGAGGQRLEKDLCPWAWESQLTVPRGGRVGGGAGGFLGVSRARQHVPDGPSAGHSGGTWARLELVLQSWGQSRRGCEPYLPSF